MGKGGGVVITENKHAKLARLHFAYRVAASIITELTKAGTVSMSVRYCTHTKTILNSLLRQKTGGTVTAKGVYNAHIKVVIAYEKKCRGELSACTEQWCFCYFPRAQLRNCSSGFKAGDRVDFGQSSAGAMIATVPRIVPRYKTWPQESENLRNGIVS